MTLQRSLKLLIIRQQELAAKFVRTGNNLRQARRATSCWCCSTSSTWCKRSVQILTRTLRRDRDGTLRTRLFFVRLNFPVLCEDYFNGSGGAGTVLRRSSRKAGE